MKAKHLILTAYFFLTALFTSAQEKFDFLIIEYSFWSEKITVSINGNEYIKEKADLTGQDKTDKNSNPLLRKVGEYQNKGWELMNFQALSLGSSGTSTGYIAYMRKKKPE
jgi:hypothetical protein